MTVQNELNAIENDRGTFEGAHGTNNQQLLTYAARRSGLSPLTLGRDFMRHSRSGRGIDMGDYVRHELWDKDRHGPDGADRYIGASMVWPVSNTVNSKTWFSAAEDKFFMSSMLATDGLPQPETVTVVDTSARSYPGLTKAETPEALRDAVLAHPAGALFIKMLDGMTGSGAMVIEAADAQTITTTGMDPLPYDRFMTEVLGGRAYMIQKRLDNHADLAPFCTGLATIRLPAFVRGGDISVPMGALKVPTAGNVSCAYWRPGNLVCGIDPETGQITRVAGRDGPVSTDIGDHPEKPGLKGLMLPFWDQVRDIHQRACRIFGAIPYQSTDIALTPDGPVLVELNYAGSFDILQNGTGKGLLTPEIRSFFTEHGYGFVPRKRKKILGVI